MPRPQRRQARAAQSRMRAKIEFYPYPPPRYWLHQSCSYKRVSSVGPFYDGLRAVRWRAEALACSGSPPTPSPPAEKTKQIGSVNQKRDLHFWTTTHGCIPDRESNNHPAWRRLVCPTRHDGRSFVRYVTNVANDETFRKI